MITSWLTTQKPKALDLYADGGQISTMPYIASTIYLNKMSDYCLNCSYNQKDRISDKACPFNSLYWNFILENEERLRANLGWNKVY